MRTTSFDTAKNRFTIDFGGGYTLVHESKMQVAYLAKNGDPKGTFSTEGMLLSTFEGIVDMIEESLK